jgi:NAD(P)-dependent dehydrogenase (short-subunit alcohol dehydrogenase family)
MYGRLDEGHSPNKRRLFDVNFWGVVHGCRAALRHLRQHGGAIINIGSVASDRAIPLLGIYAASKHAVKAYHRHVADGARSRGRAGRGHPDQADVNQHAVHGTRAATTWRRSRSSCRRCNAPEEVAPAYSGGAGHPTRD